MLAGGTHSACRWIGELPRLPVSLSGPTPHVKASSRRPASNNVNRPPFALPYAAAATSPLVRRRDDGISPGHDREPQRHLLRFVAESRLVAFAEAAAHYGPPSATMKRLLPAASLFLALLVPLPAADTPWRIGLAAVKITPEEPVLMYGYGGRNDPHQGVASDLFAKALALEDSTGQRLRASPRKRPRTDAALGRGVLPRRLRLRAQRAHPAGGRIRNPRPRPRRHRGPVHLRSTGPHRRRPHLAGARNQPAEIGRKRSCWSEDFSEGCASSQPFLHARRRRRLHVVRISLPAPASHR